VFVFKEELDIEAPQRTNTVVLKAGNKKKTFL
jgi:hypothetical protein